MELAAGRGRSSREVTAMLLAFVEATAVALKLVVTAAGVLELGY